jgi:hypothetical protein
MRYLPNLERSFAIEPEANAATPARFDQHFGLNGLWD